MKQSIYIEAPVETAFDFCMDPMKSADLMPMDTEYLEVKMTEEGTGSYMSWRSKIAGVPIEGFDVYTEVVPNQRITEMSSRAVVGTWDSTFEPAGTGTRLTMEHRSRSFWALPLLRNALDMVVSRANAALLPKLKAAIEAEARMQKATPPRQRKPAQGKPRKAPASH